MSTSRYGVVLVIVVAVDRQVEEVGPRGGERRGAVAVVQVHVDHGQRADGAGGVQHIGGHHQAVEGAEAFAVVGVGVMEAADQRGGDPVVAAPAAPPPGSRRRSDSTDG